MFARKLTNNLNPQRNELAAGSDLSRPVNKLPVRPLSTGANSTTSLEAQADRVADAAIGLPGGDQQELKVISNHDFSNVRIHTGTAATRASDQFNARAFTLGQDIYLSQSAFNPNSLQGQHLLAHELTHVVQQQSGAAPVSVQCQERGAAIPSMGLPGQRVPLTSPSLARLLGQRTVDGFRFGRSALSNDQTEALETHASTLASLLRDYPAGLIEISGHTDAPGEDTDNMALGRARAEAARDVLTAQGIDPGAIMIFSEGEERLREQVTTRSPRNRRVEIRFLPTVLPGLGLDLDLSPLPSPDGSIPDRPRVPMPWEYRPPIPYPGEPVGPGPRRPTRPLPMPIDLPQITRTPDQSFLRVVSEWLTGTMHRRDIARIAARMAAELGMDEAEIRDKLDDAMISGGEEGLKAILKAVLEAVFGPATEVSPGQQAPFPVPELPRAPVINLPPIRF